MSRSITLPKNDLNNKDLVLKVDNVAYAEVDYEQFQDEFNDKFTVKFYLVSGGTFLYNFDTLVDMETFLDSLETELGRCCPPVVFDQDLIQGLTYYDIANDYMYVTFGEDDNWYAIRFREIDETTGTQTGTKPTTLVVLQGLTYTPV